MNNNYDRDSDVTVRKANVSPSWFVKGPIISREPTIPLELLTCKQALYSGGAVVIAPTLVTLKSEDETEYRCLWLPAQTATLVPGTAYEWVIELESTEEVVPHYRYELRRGLHVISELLTAA